MRRLALPVPSAEEVFSDCLSKVNDPVLATKYNANSSFLYASATEYHHLAVTSDLYNLPRTVHTTIVSPNGKRERDDPIVFGTLRKSELTNLYTYYMVRSNMESRRHYDKIKVSAHGKCPFCGGIGNPKTLDHYLPKAHYPSFSILPINLVPCCRDCNSAKSAAFSEKKSDQSLHPYMEPSHFFDDNWLHAEVIETVPPSINYYVKPPEAWTECDKLRVENHVKDFDLISRFSDEAASQLSILLDQRIGHLSTCSPTDFRKFLLETAYSNELRTNHWQRAMYKCLANSQWFCENLHLKA